VDKEGSASPTVAAAELEFAARGKNSMHAERMLKIPDAADEIKLHVAKNTLEERRRGAGPNQLQITHLPHLPTRKEATCSSLQPHCC
jgi:hypothetical protein